MFKLPFKKTSLDVEKILRETPAGEMLVDSFEKVVGTPEEQGYSELALYAYSDTKARLERYEDGGLATEQKTVYLVPIAAARDALNAVKDAGMDTWDQQKKITCLCGMSRVCRFRTADGAYIRVSGEKMPPHGTAAFGAVSAALYRYAREEYQQ